MFKFNTMTIWNSKQPKTLSTYTLNHIHHVFCWVISPCGLSDWHLNLILRQFKFITSIKIWVHSHTGPFMLDTVLSLHLFSALTQNPQWSTNQCHILSYSPPWWCQSKSILVAYICIVMTNALSSLYKQGHLNPQMLVFSAFEDCSVVVFLINPVVAVVCVTHTILWFETSPSIRILNFCRDVLRSYEHNLRRFLLQFQPGWSWYGQPFNYSH